MNKTKIDWCDSSWNPVTGCFHDCKYCYARKIAIRFGGASETHNNECCHECQWCTEAEGKIHVLNEPIYDCDMGRNAPYPWEFDPTFHRYRLNEYQNKKKTRNIFVCSMADLFGKWVPDDWITEVFAACKAAPQHNYMFLTKNPERYIDLKCLDKLPLDDNFWYGTTVTDSHMPYMGHDGHYKFHTFLSIEPILEDFGEFDGEWPPDWVIIGAETGSRKDKVVPEKAWIDSLVSQCKERNIPVFMKESLRAFYGDDLLREFPKGLLHG